MHGSVLSVAGICQEARVARALVGFGDGRSSLLFLDALTLTVLGEYLSPLVAMHAMHVHMHGCVCK